MSLPIALGVATTATPALAAAGPPSAFTALATPVRLADTRISGTLGNVPTPIAVTGIAPLPAAGTITAAVLNVTVVGPSDPGFWSVFPDGAAVPNASNINVDGTSAFYGAGLALPNLVTVPVPANGIVDVFASAGGNVVVDMLGYYSPTATATAGRFVPLSAPSRMTDTRITSNPLTLGETRDFVAPGAAGASAVALNVTTIGDAPGFWQVFPSGTSPKSSNLNTLAAGQTTANQVIVPVDPTGKFSITSQSGGQVIIDVIGTFTGAAAPASTDGLFVPLSTPTRFLDTRSSNLNPLGANKRLLGGWDVEVPVSSNAAIGRPDVAAVVMNLTVTDTFGSGYVSVTPAGSNDPASKTRSTSNINVARIDQTVANHAIVPVSSRGFDIFAQAPLHAIADVSGFYLGAPVAAPFGGPSNVDPTPAGCLGFAVSAIGTSAQGNANANIAIAQQRLLDLGFWLQNADGTFGLTTQQAVMAYQKWTGMTPASGKIDAATAQKLMSPNCRPTTSYKGDLLEVDKGKQLALFISGGKVQYTINTSTGGGYFYTAVDENNGNPITGTAITTNGTFHIYRVADDPAYHGSLGTLYRPRFIVGGIAMHGYPSVPNYPASHGCVRVTNAWMDQVWAQNLLPMGKTVVIHD
ncbi:MAG: hypothetical protein JWN39_3073 [Ilumatobacteraceae bacterium]|nr:hypothetical protein [Ilumatobacteraceae bacterium]